MLDNTIKLAINEAVKKSSQPKELSQKIVSWMEKLSEGDEAKSDREAYMRRAKLCYDSTVLSNKNGNNGS